VESDAKLEVDVQNIKEEKSFEDESKALPVEDYVNQQGVLFLAQDIGSDGEFFFQDKSLNFSSMV
jgi:hypothetical protein